MTISEAGRDTQQRDQARALLVERIRTGCACLLVGAAVFLIVDLLHARAVFARLLPVKLVQLGAIVSMWAALRSPRVQRRPLPILLLFSAVYSATVSAQNVVRGDIATGALTTVLLLLVTAVQLPAGVGVQIALVAMTSASLLAGVYASTGGLAAAFTLPALPIWAAAGASVVIAQQRRRSELMIERQQRALRASGERLRLVLDATNDGIWDWDVETGEVHYSQRWVDALGYTSAEVPAHVSFRERLVHPDDVPRVHAALQAHFEGKTEIYECENRLRTKSGAWRPNLERGKVVERAADGRPLRMVGTDTDITERQRRQNELTALLAVSQDITGTLDRVEIMQRVQTHAAAALSCERVGTFYFDPERGVYRQFSQFGTPPELQSAAEQLEFQPESALVESLVAGQTIVVDSQTPQSLISNEVFASFGLTALAATPLRVRGRHLGALVALSINAARFSQAQVALLEAMARQLAVALEAADLYEIERDRAQESAALARVGQEMIASLDIPVLLARLCQVTTEVLECDFSHTYLYRPLDDVFVAVAGFGDPPERWEALEERKIPRARIHDLVERLEAGAVVQVGRRSPQQLMSARLRAAHGITHTLLVPLRRGGEITGVHSAGFRGREQPFSRRGERIAAGIATMASLALENARLVEELDRANSVKGDFVASMSHELRNPLNILIGYHELLLDGAFDPLTEKQSEIVTRLQHQSHDLLTMINATLDLSGLESGRVPLRWEHIDVGALVAAVARDTHPRTAASPVRVEVAIDASLSGLQTDAGKLKLVLANLLGNALKFTAQGCITISARPYAGGVELAVTDTGMGIAPEAQHRVFEPFQQADASIATRFGGAGLGLHIVRRMVHLLGGTVELESELGRGSTFRVWLPGAAADDGVEPVRKDGTTGMGV